MKKKKKKRMKPVVPFKTYEEFWYFCLNKCPNHRIGCALKCIFRKQLNLPPFGDKYIMHGKIGGRNG